MSSATYPIDALCGDLAGIDLTTDPAQIRRKSQDRNAVSPLLRKMLAGKSADIVVTPTTLEELRRTVSAAVRHRIPITLRGGGTANYGQSVPLHGGIVVDMTGYAGIVSLKPGTVRVRAGMVVEALEAETRKAGWELRFQPTTRKTATIGGHVAGGQGGPGSVVYGTWRDRGNIGAAQVMTIEEKPRLIELRGNDTQLIHHTYGATGIITELDLPLAPAWMWTEGVVAFPQYMQAVCFGVALANATGIIRKLASVQEWPTPRLFKSFGEIVPEGHSIVSTMIAQESWESFAQFVTESGGTIVSSAAEGAGSYRAPLTEFVFGHALVQIQKSEPRRTVLEGFLRAPDLLGLIERVHAKVRHFGPMRVELIRIGGELVATGSPYFLYESPAQMADLVRQMQDAGALVANSHTSNVRLVGKKEITARDIAFKRTVDPHGLLNPGRFEIDDAADAKFDLGLPTNTWSERLG